jgi:hypothetical protein
MVRPNSKKVCWCAGENLISWAKENREDGGFKTTPNYYHPNNLYKLGILQVFAWWLPWLASPLLTGCGSANASAVE